MSTSPLEPPRLTVDYHDGRSEQAQPVAIWVSRGMLELAGHGVLRQVPIRHLLWPDLTQREDVRIIVLPGGGSLRGHDPSAWDAWQAQQPLALPRSVVPESWRWSLVAGLLLALVAASYVFALPPLSSG